MATRMSTGLKGNMLGSAADGSFKDLMAGGIGVIYSGAQPATADLTESGTKLLEVTLGGKPFSKITGVTKANPGVVTAVAHGLVNGDTVKINAVAGMVELNGNTYTVTKITNDTFSIGVDTSGAGYTAYSSGGSCNGLTWDNSVAAVLSKATAEGWQGAGITNGTAGYFRFYDATYGTGASSSANRVDMAVGTVGTEVIITSTGIVEDVNSIVTAASFQFAA